MRLTQNRLLAITRGVLAQYPEVRRWVESTDVLQNAEKRLEGCFKDELIETSADYFRFAAKNIRWEVIDLFRHYYGPLGIGRNHATPNGDRSYERPEEHVVTDRDDPARLALGREIHESVDELPAELRDVVHFHYYLGMSFNEVAQALGVSLSTVKRRHVEAKELLKERLGPQSSSA